MYNLSTVVNFEIIRTLKKKSFWIMAFGFPFMMAIIFGIVFLSNEATSDAVDKLKDQQFSIEITDESNLISSDMLASLHIKSLDAKDQGVDNVKNGKIDSYIYVPSDLSKNPVEIYGKSVDIFNNGRYETVARYILEASVQANTSSQIQQVLASKFSTVTKTYKDGQVYDPTQEMIVPGAFLILFYLLIAFFGNQMLTSTTEEKENRVIEMILTTIEAKTLIVGKIMSLILLALLQGAIIVVPALLGYILLGDQLKLPSIDLSSLPFNWSSIGIAILIFSSSFMLFTGLLVLIGSSVPTAKDAGGFIGIVMMMLFGPLYAITLFVSSPDSPLVIGLSLFPLTAPIPLLLRNAVGNLQPWEIAVAIPILVISAYLTITLAVRVFRYGALEYSRKISLKEIFTKK